MQRAAAAFLRGGAVRSPRALVLAVRSSGGIAHLCGGAGLARRRAFPASVDWSIERELVVNRQRGRPAICWDRRVLHLLDALAFPTQQILLAFYRPPSQDLFDGRRHEESEGFAGDLAAVRRARRGVHLGLAQLLHADLQCVHHRVVLEAKVLGQRRLQEVTQFLHLPQLQQPL